MLTFSDGFLKKFGSHLRAATLIYEAANPNPASGKRKCKRFSFSSRPKKKPLTAPDEKEYHIFAIRVEYWKRQHYEFDIKYLDGEKHVIEGDAILDDLCYRYCNKSSSVRPNSETLT